MSLSKEQLMLEYARCMKNTPYALKTYLQTYDNTVQKYVPLELFSDQINLINDYDTYDENIALKYRQAGVSTATAGWISKVVAFARKEKPEKVLIIANKLDTAIEMANKVRAFIGQWPPWVKIDFTPEKNAARHFKLNNGSEVKAVATSKDALRGYSPTILVFDEAAYIDADDDFWAACMASLSTGGKVIVISTPNGFDPIYYSIYDQSVRGMNDFKVTEMYWYRDPRYTKDLYLVKTDDIVDYLLRKDEQRDNEIIDFSHISPTERDFDLLKDYFSKGYKPCSSWFEKMVKKLKFDKRKVAQELDCKFLGSGDNVIDSKILENIRENMIREPLYKTMGGALWIWKEPEIGHKYILGQDISRGDSEDFSTFEIIDFDTREQVAEYIGKVPPDVMAEIAYKWGKTYNAFIVTDITGGMGVATSRKLQELGYKDLYIDGIELGNKWKYDAKSAEKIPGINFNNKRVQIISSLEEALRHDFKVYSTRLLNEFNTFIYINGRPDHQKGQHDDLIMSLAIAIYTAEFSFTQLNKVTEHTKVMIESWHVNTYENKNPSHFFNPQVSFNDDISVYRNTPSRRDYENNSWLFGNRK
jgi:phage FluMu gp28-like protein